MHIKTRYFGEMEIPANDVIRFPEGILGFPDSKNFALIEVEENPYLKALQDIDNEHLSFMVIRPWDFFEDYEANISDHDLAQVGITTKTLESFSLHTIITIGNSISDSTANLVAPIVINHDSKTGKQFVLDASGYGTKHPLQPESAGV
jgi:flagellar assembly factor FliW